MLIVPFADGSLQGPLFYLLSGVVVFLGSAFFFREETKARIALLTLSLFVPLYLVEGFFFYQLSHTAPDAFIQMEHRARLAEQAGLPYDKRSKLQVIQDLRASGIDAYPSSAPTLFVKPADPQTPGRQDALLPLGGVSNKTTVFCNEEGFWSTYESDEHGFNNPRGLYNQARWDIALIGDSFTQGACVHPGDDLGAQLRRLRGEHATLANLSAWGNGPLLELATLKEYARPFQPKTVLWLYYEHNDLAGRGIGKEMKSPLLTAYLTEPAHTQHLFTRQAEIDSVLSAFIDVQAQKVEAALETQEATEETDVPMQARWTGIFRFSHLRTMLRDLRRKRNTAGFFGDKAHEQFRAVLLEARDQVAAWGGRLHVVYLPSWKRYTLFVDQDALYDRQKVLTMVREAGIPLIDFHETLAAHPDPQSLFPFRIHAHYTAEGYRLLADHIDRALATPLPGL